MEKYTEEQKKEYNDYWSYYYGTDFHDYYADCMAQYAEGSKEGSQEGEGAEPKEGEEEGGKKKGKKRKPQQRDQGMCDFVFKMLDLKSWFLSVSVLYGKGDLNGNVSSTFSLTLIFKANYCGYVNIYLIQYVCCCFL